MFYYTRPSDGPAKLRLRKDSEMEAIKREDFHLTVYSQNEREPDDGDFSKIKLKGDLILDIDAASLEQAIEWLHKTLDALDKWGVVLNHLDIFCSGSKGFHITVPQKIFAEDRAMVYLNKYHGWMVANMETLIGVKYDLGLYHKKHTIRIENRPRLIGTYKVPITLEEARNITPELYQSYVSQPRHLSNVSQLVPATAFCEKLNELWTLAKEEVKKELARAAKFSAIPDEVLDVFTDDYLPQCIEWMRDNSSVKGGYNDVSMQLAAFVGKAGKVSAEAKEKLILDFARNTKSDSRQTLTAKIEHTRNVIRRVDAGAFQFSCGGCRSVLTGNPCNGCPVKAKQELDAEEESQIEIREDGYYVMSKGAGTRLTSFTMDRINQISSIENGYRVHHSDLFEIKTRNEGTPNSGLVTITASDWNTIGRFKDKVSAVSGAIVFQTSDLLLANLHNYINTTQSSEQYMKVDQAGIHVVKAEDQEEAFWAEDGWSLDEGGIAGNNTYTGDAKDTVMSLRGVDYARPDDPHMVDIMTRLLDSNRPEIVGQLLGWSGACHLKEHFHKAGYFDFPLMHIAGKPGSGKTSSATVYATLTGCLLPGGPMAVDSTTPSPLRQAMSQTTTVARVFDEFNRPNMAHNRYLTMLGYLKAAYCRQNLAAGYVKKGAIGEVGAATKNLYATAPVIYMSREATENEELVQRSIIIRVNQEDHEVGSWKENFQAVHRSLAEVVKDGSPLQRMCKSLVREAVNTRTSQCHEWFQEAQADLPGGEHSRRLHNLFVLRTGLKFVRRAFSDFPEHIQKRLETLDAIVVASWQKEEEDFATKRSRWTTSETLLETLAQMAAVPAGAVQGKILPGNYYVRQGATLYLNTKLCFTMYRLYTKSVGIMAEVSSSTSMLDLLKTAKSYIGENGPNGEPVGSGWVALDISQLEGIGFYAEGFEED